MAYESVHSLARGYGDGSSDVIKNGAKNTLCSEFWRVLCAIKMWQQTEEYELCTLGRFFYGQIKKPLMFSLTHDTGVFDSKNRMHNQLSMHIYWRPNLTRIKKCLKTMIIPETTLTTHTLNVLKIPHIMMFLTGTIVQLTCHIIYTNLLV